MNNITYIYGLKQGADGSIRYIGKTRNVKQRREQHLARPKFLAEWISTFADRRELVLEILEETTSDIAGERERFYIEEYSNNTGGLFNIKCVPQIQSQEESPNARVVYVDRWQCNCGRCGNEWISRTEEKPLICGKCKSVKWDD